MRRPHRHRDIDDMSPEDRRKAAVIILSRGLLRLMKASTANTEKSPNPPRKPLSFPAPRA